MQSFGPKLQVCVYMRAFPKLSTEQRMSSYSTANMHVCYIRLMYTSFRFVKLINKSCQVCVVTPVFLSAVWQALENWTVP